MTAPPISGHCEVAVKLLVSILACVVLLMQLAVAQTPATGPSTDPASTPDLQLNAAQKQTIYTSVRNLNMKNEAPPNFQPIVGAVVPTEVKLEPMPQTIGELTPRVKDFQVALIANQVVIADPKGRRVVEVIAGEKN
jgi:hypothetical protein